MKTLIILLLQEQSDLCLHCLPRPICPKTDDNYGNLKSINTDTPHLDKSMEICNESNLYNRFLKKQVLVKMNKMSDIHS